MFIPTDGKPGSPKRYPTRAMRDSMWAVFGRESAQPIYEGSDMRERERDGAFPPREFQMQQQKLMGAESQPNSARPRRPRQAEVDMQMAKNDDLARLEEQLRVTPSTEDDSRRVSGLSNPTALWPGSEGRRDGNAVREVPLDLYRFDRRLARAEQTLEYVASQAAQMDAMRTRVSDLSSSVADLRSMFEKRVDSEVTQMEERMRGHICQQEERDSRFRQWATDAIASHGEKAAAEKSSTEDERDLLRTRLAEVEKASARLELRASAAETALSQAKHRLEGLTAISQMQSAQPNGGLPLGAVSQIREIVEEMQGGKDKALVKREAVTLMRSPSTEDPALTFIPISAGEGGGTGFAPPMGHSSNFQHNPAQVAVTQSLQAATDREDAHPTVLGLFKKEIAARLAMHGTLEDQLQTLHLRLDEVNEREAAALQEKRRMHEETMRRTFDLEQKEQDDKHEMERSIAALTSELDAAEERMRQRQEAGDREGHAALVAAEERQTATARDLLEQIGNVSRALTESFKTLDSKIPVTEQKVLNSVDEALQQQEKLATTHLAAVITRVQRLEGRAARAEALIQKEKARRTEGIVKQNAKADRIIKAVDKGQLQLLKELEQLRLDWQEMMEASAKEIQLHSDETKKYVSSEVRAVDSRLENLAGHHRQLRDKESRFEAQTAENLSQHMKELQDTDGPGGRGRKGTKERDKKA
uniref:Uncharacterized protein n=1 Tax=Chromera velia CCMP2878 TaxID=1169474 RepID=A0A0K6S6I9_9ALVE|eukprot:Cvel_15865.t2-p1 / transcript=Cvel_15865.t2 / gene=Cvel_15865 / organism=Chromera_velia_CCMP2878 / gene_product=hypothetical protein / transcript_product=hypothetical protein / location=Cvel_scaffold1196:21907-27422(+) / protein_length=701 / sequence_SO=supercontig / SO=protein_coding / is_pseudo=false